MNGAVSLSQLRQRVASGILSAMAGDQWQETTGTFDTFGTGDGDNRHHKAFAVGVLSTEYLGKDRQTIAEGTVCGTDLRVRWAYNLAAMAQLGSYDAALDAEALIIAGALTARGKALHLEWKTAERSVDDQGWMTGEMAFAAMHRIPLS